MGFVRENCKSRQLKYCVLSGTVYRFIEEKTVAALIESIVYLGGKSYRVREGKTV
jgi:hypothetical protein